jgi:hypothetical protein
VTAVLLRRRDVTQSQQVLAFLAASTQNARVNTAQYYAVAVLTLLANRTGWHFEC